MAVIMVLMSGWIGLAFAVLGQIFTDATMNDFFVSWTQAGLVTATAMVLVLAVRHATHIHPAQTA